MFGKPKSLRNRHTGHINAFKKAIIQNGKKFVRSGRTYYAAVVGKGITVVRTR